MTGIGMPISQSSIPLPMFVSSIRPRYCSRYAKITVRCLCGSEHRHCLAKRRFTVSIISYCFFASIVWPKPPPDQNVFRIPPKNPRLAPNCGEGLAEPGNALRHDDAVQSVLKIAVLVADMDRTIAVLRHARCLKQNLRQVAIRAADLIVQQRAVEVELTRPE